MRSACSGRCSARSSSSRRGSSCSSSSSASGAGRSPSAAPTTPTERARLSAELDSLDLPGTEALIRSFGLYFQLVNLAEERHRVRTLRRRERGARQRDPRRLGRRGDASDLARRARLDEMVGLVDRLAIAPVLTAHPTEARRRTLLVALRRCSRLLERLDDPRLTPDEDRDIRRRLREEISLLWRTSDLRSVAPTPLDEVRTAMTYFDETLFTVVPRLYRAIDGALDPLAETERRRALGGRAARRAGSERDRRRADRDPPVTCRRVPALGAWIGGDRDGNPEVTAEMTGRRPADPRRPRDPRLRSGRDRLMQTRRGDRRRGATWRRPSPGGSSPTTRSCPRRCASSAALPRRAVSPAFRGDRRATPADPRGADRGPGSPIGGRYADAGRAAGRARRDCSGARGRRAGACRLGRGPGLPLAGRDVRLPPGVARGPPAQRGPRGGPRRDPARRARARAPGSPGVTAAEVLATFRAIADEPGALRPRPRPGAT